MTQKLGAQFYGKAERDHHDATYFIINAMDIDNLDSILWKSIPILFDNVIYLLDSHEKNRQQQTRTLFEEQYCRVQLLYVHYIRIPNLFLNSTLFPYE